MVNFKQFVLPLLAVGIAYGAGETGITTTAATTAKTTTTTIATTTITTIAETTTTTTAKTTTTTTTTAKTTTTTDATTTTISTPLSCKFTAGSGSNGAIVPSAECKYIWNLLKNYFIE